MLLARYPNPKQKTKQMKQWLTLKTNRSWHATENTKQKKVTRVTAMIFRTAFTFFRCDFVSASHKDHKRRFKNCPVIHWEIEQNGIHQLWNIRWGYLRQIPRFKLWHYESNFSHMKHPVTEILPLLPWRESLEVTFRCRRYHLCRKHCGY